MGKNAVFMSNYVCMTPVKDIQMYPGTVMEGENSVARYNTIVYASKGTHFDLGSKAILKAKGCKAELIARTITKGGYIASRGLIQGDTAGIKTRAVNNAIGVGIGPNDVAVQCVSSCVVGAQIRVSATYMFNSVAPLIPSFTMLRTATMRIESP